MPDLTASLTAMNESRASRAASSTARAFKGSCSVENVTSPVAGDVTFVSQLIDQLTAAFHLDKSRIFIVGVSAGA
jgi:poly(3-hydroxybutyrate) depolymerase